MSLSTAFPSRAYIQQFDGTLPPDYQIVFDELVARGVPVICSTSFPADISKDELVVGDFSWTRNALKQLGVPLPSPPDYPACLTPYLHRRIWQSTLGGVRSILENRTTADPTPIFIKPAVRERTNCRFVCLPAACCPENILLSCIDLVLATFPDERQGFFCNCRTERLHDRCPARWHPWSA